MSTSVVHPANAPQSQSRTRAIGLGLAGLVIALGIGLGLSADRSAPAPIVDSEVTRFEPSFQARRLERMAELRAERAQREELAKEKAPVDGSIRRS